jgi:hypothetical protein
MLLLRRTALSSQVFTLPRFGGLCDFGTVSSLLHRGHNIKRYVPPCLSIWASVPDRPAVLALRVRDGNTEIGGIAEPADFLDPTSRMIRLENTPVDQQRGSKRTEKPCQALLLKRKMKGEIRRLPHPFRLKLIHFERADAFEARLQ